MLLAAGDDVDRASNEGTALLMGASSRGDSDLVKVMNVVKKSSETKHQDNNRHFSGMSYVVDYYCHKCKVFTCVLCSRCYWQLVRVCSEQTKKEELH